ncbi:MAG: helix-turn-helix domain-containing protein [Chloroflexota bacterium]
MSYARPAARVAVKVETLKEVLLASGERTTMKAGVSASLLDELEELAREMEFQGRASKARALQEALVALARPARAGFTTGQAAERLGVTIPTVKAWILRGALVGRQVGDRWWVSRESVEEVLGFGGVVVQLEEEGSSTEEEAGRMTREVRRRMGAEKRAAGGRQR